MMLASRLRNAERHNCKNKRLLMVHFGERFEKSMETLITQARLSAIRSWMRNDCLLIQFRTAYQAGYLLRFPFIAVIIASLE